MGILSLIFTGYSFDLENSRLISIFESFLMLGTNTSVNVADMKAFVTDEEMNQLESVAMARMDNLDSLCEAFSGCHTIFHTSSFIDPHGISGYTERKVFLEMERARDVTEACSRTAYVKRCIFMSSSLATLWKSDDETIIDETCWSDEDFCREKKVGRKMMAIERFKEVAPVKPSAALLVEHRQCTGNAFSSSLIARRRNLVCVTSGNSYFGAHLVKKLLARGYLVRVTVQNQVSIDDMKAFVTEEEMNQLESIVVARMENLGSLCDAFSGCHAIFHTSSFIDPHGLSGYTERMAFIETEGARNVIEACARTAYVKRCLFTSSLLAAIWKSDDGSIINETCWSEEEFCREKKLWLALGKTRAEKIAWRKSRELKVKIVAVCPGLIMAPSFPNAHTETALPYLKGGQMMLRRGVLATEDVQKVAEVHVLVYEDMDYGSCGRYLCFGRTITRFEHAIQLENNLKIQGLLSGGDVGISSRETDEFPGQLSNSKLTSLLVRASKRISCMR